MLIAKNISKSFDSLQVLKGVDLNIPKGKIVSIVGKSGTGKTTLLHILGTLDGADSGSLQIDGTEVSTLDQKDLSKFRNEKIGFIFQFHHLLSEFTALENVCIPGYIKKDNPELVKKEAKKLLEYLGLGDRLDHRPTELSGGEQQRVAVARALINRPAIVFADEPTGNLDNITSNDLHEMLKGLQRDFNQTFVIVTHNEELANMSDECYVMNNGILSKR